MNVYKLKYAWSPRQWFLAIAVAMIVWLTFIFVGPGDDYNRCYTWMVNEPWRYPLVSEQVWTLNPPYQAIFMAPFVSIPGRAGYIVFMGFTLAAIVLCIHFLGGKPVPVLISAQMTWILWWGQIEVFAILGVVLGWYALQKEAEEQCNTEKEQPGKKPLQISWMLMFLALTFASFKPQIGMIPVLALWWWSGKERWKSMLALAGLLIFSMLAWGPWPAWYLQGMIRFAGTGHAEMWNSSIGLWVFLLFIPALLLPLNREQRILALAATAQLASPYLPYYSTILLLCFAIPGWAYLFAFLGYLPLVLGTTVAWNGIALLPILLLVWLYIPAIKRIWQEKRQRADPTTSDTEASQNSPGESTS